MPASEYEDWRRYFQQEDDARAAREAGVPLARWYQMQDDIAAEAKAAKAAKRKQRPADAT